MALADAPSVFEQYMMARTIFLADSDDGAAYSVNYRKTLFQGVAGRWFRISQLQPKSPDPGLFQGVCERTPVRVEVKDEYTLNFIDDEGKDTQVSTLYTNRFGSIFGVYTDPKQLLHRLGIDSAAGKEQVIANTLGFANGPATIIRPSPDILVVQMDIGWPLIYARCP